MSRSTCGAQDADMRTKSPLAGYAALAATAVLVVLIGKRERSASLQ
ncbi:hypothetical protein ACIQZB_02905 [Streptomyces sp. NPDC097727]